MGVTMPKGFKTWLNKQHRRDDAVGDLARDARVDRTWPRGRQSLKSLEQYLWGRGACPNAVRTLHSAWAEHSRGESDR
jgi:hypothetical protein